jgi:hypothetical protein
MSSLEKNARQNNEAIVHTNCYLKHRRFTTPKGHLKKVDMDSHAKSKCSTLQTLFTALKFGAAVGDALRR